MVFHIPGAGFLPSTVVWPWPRSGTVILIDLSFPNDQQALQCKEKQNCRVETQFLRTHSFWFTTYYLWGTEVIYEEVFNFIWSSNYSWAQSKQIQNETHFVETCKDLHMDIHHIQVGVVALSKPPRLWQKPPSTQNFKVTGNFSDLLETWQVANFFAISRCVIDIQPHLRVVSSLMQWLVHPLIGASQWSQTSDGKFSHLTYIKRRCCLESSTLEH